MNDGCVMAAGDEPAAIPTNANMNAHDHFEQGMSLMAQNRHPDAVLAFERAIFAKTDFYEAWNNRAICLAALGNLFDAVLNYEKAILHGPNFSEHHNNLGCALLDLEDYPRAHGAFVQAIKLKPDCAEALMNLGNCYKMRGNMPLAIRYYREAVAARPAYVDAHLNLASGLLETGNLREGWDEYEWRWKSGQLPPRGLKMPFWKGEDLSGRDIFIYAEQGFGDAIQFGRYAKVIKRLYPTARVTIEVRKPLVGLFKQSGIADHIIALGDLLPDADYGAPMMTLPKLCGTLSEDAIPAEPGYLSAHPYAVKRFGRYLDQYLAKHAGKPRIGLCWAGGHRPLHPGAQAIDRRRSTTLASFAPLAREDVVFVSLQKDGPSSQVRNPPSGPNGQVMTILDPSEDLEDFADTAALIENLDLVISVDTAVAHVAAALGKPTFVLSRFDSCWRWMGSRKDSPWYPSVTHFRQKKPGDWPSVMNEVAEYLDRWLSERKASKEAAE